MRPKLVHILALSAMALSLIFVGVLAWRARHPPQQTLVVRTGVATTGNIVDSTITITEFDQEQERLRKLRLLAGTLNRLCSDFLVKVQAAAIDSPSNSLRTDLISPAIYYPPQSQIFGSELKLELQQQQQLISSALEEVDRALSAHVVGSRSNPHLRPAEQQHAREAMARAEASFETLKQNLERHTQSHCTRIRSLL